MRGRKKRLELSDLVGYRNVEPLASFGALSAGRPVLAHAQNRSLQKEGTRSQEKHFPPFVKGDSGGFRFFCDVSFQRKKTNPP
jgi:hypothetical protein